MNFMKYLSNEFYIGTDDEIIKAFKVRHFVNIYGLLMLQRRVVFKLFVLTPRGGRIAKITFYLWVLLLPFYGFVNTYVKGAISNFIRILVNHLDALGQKII